MKKGHLLSCQLCPLTPWDAVCTWGPWDTVPAMLQPQQWDRVGTVPWAALCNQWNCFGCPMELLEATSRVALGERWGDPD